MAEGDDYYTWAESVLEPVASRKDASKYTDIESLVGKKWGKKAGKVIDSLGFKKEKSGITGHGSVYEMIFKETKKGKKMIAQPVHIRQVERVASLS